MSLQLNQIAPDFTLFNHAKQEINLASYRGKNVVLLFFPLAFTSTCTAELCNIRDNYARYNNLNAVVFGISVDSLFVLNKFKEEQKLNFDLLSDFNHSVSAAYGSLYTEFIFGMKGVSKRSAFTLDKDGAIRYAVVLENAGHQPDYQAMLDCLSGLS